MQDVFVNVVEDLTGGAYDTVSTFQKAVGNEVYDVVYQSLIELFSGENIFKNALEGLQNYLISDTGIVTQFIN